MTSSAQRLRPKVLLADDHAVVRDGLRLMLAKDFEVVGAVEDGRTLVKEAERLAPDVVLVDISMPMLNGIEATRQLRRASPRTKIVVLTMHADVTYATEVFEAGASGYILKNAPSDEIQTAIRRVLAGKTYVAPQIAEEVTPFLLTGPHQTNKKVSQLTARQREVLQLIAEGKTGKEIADVLSVSPRTVEFHKYKMMQGLGLHSTAELTRYALKHGVIAG
jgi:DNA-binding NarL/FixJ family response regulator